MFLAFFLPIFDGERRMFRAAVFSIVLTLVAGQSAALLCDLSCDPGAATECLHHDAITSARVAVNSNCTVVISSAAFVREDARRPVPHLIADTSIAIPDYLFSPVKADARLYVASPGTWPFEKRAREQTPLRI